MKNIYKLTIIFLTLCLICSIYFFYKKNTYITAEFKNLRPFHDRAPIYYNGFKIGKVVNVKPNKDYTSTIVTMRLHPKDLKLPTNISAHLKKEKNKDDAKFDYIDIIMPEKKSGYYLKDWDKIAGEKTVDFESYLSNQDPISLDAIKYDFAETVKNLSQTIIMIGDLFGTLNSMAEDVKPNIVSASNNFNKTTQNITSVSKNINNSFNENRLNTTSKNIQLTTRNVKIMTNEINEIIPLLNCATQELYKTLKNLENITSGLNKTMQKSFGGFRVLFGSPIDNKNCVDSTGG